MRKKSFRNHEIQSTHFKGPSLTIPGQTLSLRDLLERYVMSGTVETHRGVYDSDLDLPDNIEKMDVFEKLDLAKNIRDGIEQHQQMAQPTDKKQTLQRTQIEPPSAPIPAELPSDTGV